MSDLALNERLQPALLDRLIDDDRSIALFNISVDVEALQNAGLPQQALVDMLSAHGLKLQKESVADNALELQFTASRPHANPAQLRALVLTPPGAARGIALQTFATIHSSSIPNLELESTERRMLSMRKLRECVLRDLGWLFNSLSLDSEQSLEHLTYVSDSVLNFGLPSFAGQASTSINPAEAAGRLRQAIEQFEPRLSNVRVKPLPVTDGHNDGTLEFEIEAQLWGYPSAQQLQLQTRIDTISGDIGVSEGRRPGEGR